MKDLFPRHEMKLPNFSPRRYDTKLPLTPEVSVKTTSATSPGGTLWSCSIVV